MPGFQYGRERGSFRRWLRTVLVNRLRHFRPWHQARPGAVGGGFYDRLLGPPGGGVERDQPYLGPQAPPLVVSRLLELGRERPDPPV